MQINVNFIFNWEIFFRILHNFEFLDSLLSPFLLTLEERTPKAKSSMVAVAISQNICLSLHLTFYPVSDKSSCLHASG